MKHEPNVRTSAERTVLALQVARSIRSIGQGIAVVDLTLFLKDLGWSGTAIGSVLSASGIAGAVLILGVGILSDRVGRRPFLLIYELVTALCALLFFFSSNSALLASIIIITGFGRGQNGAAGPFTPAEQAWLSAQVPREHRGRIFSTNNALGFFGMAAGSVLAGANRLWPHALPGAAGFRPLFLLIFALSAVCTAVLWAAPREAGRAAEAGGGRVAKPIEADRSAMRGMDGETAEAAEGLRQQEREISRRENREMAKLAAVNMLNGLAIGFIGPLMAYWFAAKFGASSAQIGVTMGLSFVITGAASLASGQLAQRYGMVKSVVWLRMVGIVLTLLIPLLPSFWLVSVIYILRSAFNRGTQGARAALSTSLTRDHRRGFSVSMNALAMRLPSSIGPTLSGYILDAGAFSLPFYLTGALQLASNLLYGMLFRQYDRSDHEGAPAPAGQEPRKSSPGQVEQGGRS